ncbi:rhodanese-like domain-containing protein [Tateyamaria sp. SN6-1]|uniref:rhodanese-like domain-containing protein n=1 Tax=Tateyamaria sp. SN6-1 TaxID=3092148 RepID=UPI0039F4B830
MDPTFYTSPTEILPRLGTAQAPVLIDVCVPEDVAADPFRLPGARRATHRDLGAALSHVNPGQPVVVTCQKGLKLSVGMAAHLRGEGHAATALDGGVLGWGAAGLPRIAEDAGAVTYVLPTQADPDTLIAAWCITRWIAPDARLLWVPADMTQAVADRFDAHAVTPESTAHALLQYAGLTWSPLLEFVQDANHEAQGWTALLDALPRLHPSPEAVAAAALPLVDAAWTALRKDIS